MKHHFVRSALCAAVALSSAMALGAPNAQAETYRWLTWKSQNAGDSMAANIQWFVDEFAKRTGGKHKINVMWGGSAASQVELPDAISAGVGSMGDIVISYYMDKFLLNNAVSYFVPQPLSTEEIGDAMQRWHTTYPQFDQELARYNLKVIGYRPLEPYGLLCTSPVRTLADFRGKRVRSYGSAYPALFKALGATPISITTTETYEALQRGIIDCTTTGVTYTRSFQWQEVAKYYTDIPFGASYGQFIVMNLDMYKKLDPVAKKAIDELGHENHRNFVAFSKKLTADVIEGWKAKGVTHIPFPQDIFKDVIKDKDIQKLRQSWIDRATKLGVPGEKIAEELTVH
ncbi:TRAP transporter substrate-binding protein DctP [Oleispirillum naphthae]|uniref:TRAP transporter substrate-binding protein DctP n=1 Tax=Oleispirillum naphthae TaxID=2838853 RepID=UPI00308267D4